MSSLGLKKIAGKALGAAGAAIGTAITPGVGTSVGYGIGNMVSGAVGLGEDELNAKYQLSMDKKLAAYKYGLDTDFWNLQNAYNDPSAQMERLKKAGLNPNLVYGSGNVTGNSAASAPEYPDVKFNYKDRAFERDMQKQQLKLALEEHQQRITNQAIENDLARQRLVLSAKASDRADKLTRAQIANMQALLALREDKPYTKYGQFIHDLSQVRKKISDWFSNLEDDSYAYDGDVKLF